MSQPRLCLNSLIKSLEHIKCRAYTTADFCEKVLEYRRTNDLSIRDDLIHSMLYWGINYAKRFANSTGLDMEEAITVAWTGLVNGVDTYDPKRKVAPTTWASYHIHQQLSSWRRSNLSIIHIPYYIFDSTREIPEHIMEAAKQAMREPVSLSEALGITELMVEPTEVLIAEEEEAVRCQLDVLIQYLTKPVDAYVLRERAKGKTLKEIGNAIGVTRERVRQIQSRAIATLKEIVKREQIVLKETG